VNAGELSCLVAKVDAAGPKVYVTDLSLLENRFQFKRYIERSSQHSALSGQRVKKG
jgi:sulfopyruvate decarboxylase subunit beta